MTLIATGQALVVLTRNVDLSVGSIVGFTAFFHRRPAWPARRSCIPCWRWARPSWRAACWGRSTAWWSPTAGFLPSLPTLGTLALYRSLLVKYSGAQSITTNVLPEWLLAMPRTTVVSFGDLDIPVDLRDRRRGRDRRPSGD